MTDREKLLKRLQVCDFALNDAALFLDSHPDNAMALDYYKKYQVLRKEALEAYTEKYGPVSRNDFSGGSRWNWIDGPWPWQHQEEEATHVEL